MLDSFQLIRRIICAAAFEHGEEPRQISFTRTCSRIPAAWSTLGLGLYGAGAVELLLEEIASLEVPLRGGPDRTAGTETTPPPISADA